MQFDTQKLEMAAAFMRSLAGGLHPITRKPLPNDTILNEPETIRCLYTVSEILEDIRKASARKSRAVRLPYSRDGLPPFEYTKDMPVTQFTSVLNEHVDPDRMKKLSYVRITSWLTEKGFLELVQDPHTGNSSRVVTPAGCSIGLYMENRVSARGPYQVCMYSRNAQEYIAEHLEEITAD